MEAIFAVLLTVAAIMAFLFFIVFFLVCIMALADMGKDMKHDNFNNKPNNH